MFRTFRLAAIPLAMAIAGGLGALVQFSEEASSQTTALGPFVTALTSVTSASTQIIGQNPARRAIQFCNPSTHIFWIAPQPVVAAANGAGSISIPAVATGTTTCFTPPSNVNGALGAGWNGLDATSGGNLTILEYPN
jgi:hypothetical protein